MKLMSLLTMTVLIVIGARSFHSSSPSSPFNPGNVARHGIAAICADEQAAADAAGSPTTVGLGADLAAPVGSGSGIGGSGSGIAGSGVGALGTLQGVAGGSLTCQTTTTTGP